MGSNIVAGLIGLILGGFGVAVLTFLVFDVDEPARSFLVIPGLVVGGWAGYRIALASSQS